MSLEITRHVNEQHPELLQTNLGSTCHEFTKLVVAELNAQGHDAYLMCKTAGEGQYTPPGFVAHPITGSDGKTYQCTGVSHDAIWSDGAQFDTVASANDGEVPIYNPDGSRIVGTPVWNAIAPEHWRPNNPPLKDASSIAPTPPTSFPYPDENTAGKAFQDRVTATYAEAKRKFPDPKDPEAFRHFMRYGYSSHEMPEPDAADKHIAELRDQLGLPVVKA